MTGLAATSAEEQAFAAMYERAYEKAHAQARWYVEGDAVGEVLQEAATTVWERWHEFRPDQRSARFFVGIVLKCAKNRVRRDLHQEAMFVSLDDTTSDALLYPASDPSPLAVAEHESDYAAIMRRVYQLPPRVREVWLLHHEGEYTPAEIGDALDLSPITVRRHLARAVEMLRDGLLGTTQRRTPALRATNPIRDEVTHD